MNPGQYQEWMKQAFLMCEGALAMELATETRLNITEEYLRSNIVRGLILAKSSEASRVAKESSVSWGGNGCHFDTSHTPTGRPIQHDVAVLASGADQGLACEVKWLTQQNSKDVASDVWKLALSRSTRSEATAQRSYLVLGGESGAFSSTLSALHKIGFNLRWSPAGRGGKWPDPGTVALEKSLTTSLGKNSWRDLVAWGARPKHLRDSPDTWRSLRVSLRGRWYRTVKANGKSVGWRVALWELDHRGVSASGSIAWPSVYGGIGRSC